MPKQPETTVTAISDVVGKRVREIRRRRDQSVDQLAQAAADAGHPELTRDAIYAIESGRRLEGRRRRTVSVDELWAFSEVFDVPLSVLLWPLLQPGGPVSTLVFDSPQERADFLETVGKLLEQVHGISAPAETTEQEGE
jgi:transcriptional regulator with XRE-family HTH domain